MSWSRCIALSSSCLWCSMKHGIVRLHIHIVEVYGVRTEDEVIQSGDGDIVFFH